MSPQYRANPDFCDRFPRVSGDEPFRDAMAKGEITFSPYERG